VTKRGAPRRGNAEMHLAVIASAAKQSILSLQLHAELRSNYGNYGASALNLRWLESGSMSMIGGH
jgi:hypothetical protein